MAIKNKRILITAGPTWVPIDSVRVISNIASGETGILLAQGLARQGAQVTLLLGPVALAMALPKRRQTMSFCPRGGQTTAFWPVADCCLNKKIKVVHFKFFEELKAKIIRELRTKEYAAVIHSAAVSDYQPAKLNRRKIKSGYKSLKLNLVPTPKIINLVKKIDPAIFLVGFKFEPVASKLKLIKEARRLIYNTQADFVVANTMKEGNYLAYLVMDDKQSEPIFAKKDLVENLIKAITRK